MPICGLLSQTWHVYTLVISCNHWERKCKVNAIKSLNTDPYTSIMSTIRSHFDDVSHSPHFNDVPHTSRILSTYIAQKSWCLSSEDIYHSRNIENILLFLLPIEHINIQHPWWPRHRRNRKRKSCYFTYSQAVANIIIWRDNFSSKCNTGESNHIDHQLL